MTSLKTRRQKFGIGSLLLLLFMGGMFTFIGSIVVNSTAVNSDWTRTSGEIVEVSQRFSDGNTMYTPIVKYTVDGQSYKSTSSVSTSWRPNKGEDREVAYNPSDPKESSVIESGITSWIMYIFPLAGLLLLALGPILFIRSLKRSRNIKRLIQSGQKLQGVLVDIQTSTYNNKKAGYKIVVAATDQSGAVQNYVSDSLTGIGGLAMSDFRNTPIPIDVFVNPSNPKDYYVDVDDIPTITAERITQLLGATPQATQPSSSPSTPLQVTPQPQYLSATPETPQATPLAAPQYQPAYPETPATAPQSTPQYPPASPETPPTTPYQNQQY